MAKCMACDKTTLLTKKFGNTILCGNCANAINFSSWSARNFSSMEELVDRKQNALQLANANGMKKEIVESIAKYFDEYINDGFVTSINGKAGQTLNIFSEYCIVNTKSESAKISLENMFYQFDYDDDDEEDDDELVSLNDKKKLVQGLMTGKIIQTGIGVAMSASLKEKEKEQKEEKRSRERHRRLEKIIKVGDKKIYLKNICEVETFSKSNTANGYLKFIPNGVKSDDLYSCDYFFFNNSIPFETKKIKQKIENICNIINEKISNTKKEVVEEKHVIVENKGEQQNNGVDDSFEKIRKYKELLDEGILSEEEFNKKKKELLDL